MANHYSPRAAFGGFVTGMLAGGALGLLLAPASGRMTRARVNHRIRETAESAREIKNRVGLRLRETAGSARGLEERLRRRLRRARHAVLELKAS
jgi:gas vesicle protein